MILRDLGKFRKALRCIKSTNYNQRCCMIASETVIQQSSNELDVSLCRLPYGLYQYGEQNHPFCREFLGTVSCVGLKYVNLGQEIKATSVYCGSKVINLYKKSGLQRNSSCFKYRGHYSLFVFFRKCLYHVKILQLFSISSFDRLIKSNV